MSHGTSVRTPHSLHVPSAEAFAVEDIPPDVEAWRASDMASILDLDDPDLTIIIDSIRLMRIAGVEVEKPDMLRLAIEAGRRRAAEVTDDRAALASMRKRSWKPRARTLAAGVPRGVIYYMRMGNRCKIGWTSNLRRRIENIQPEELLALEAGGQKHETIRHAQFDEYHVVGEWFRYEGDLVAHVEALRSRSV